MPKTQYAAAAGPLVHTGAGRLAALLVTNSTAAAVAFTVYDNTSAAGTVLLTVNVPAGQAPTMLHFPADLPVTFATGLYLAGAAAGATVYAWAVGF